MRSYRYSIATFPSKWKSTSCLLAATRQRGLTLLELLVTLAVVAIVISIGAPSLSGGLNDSRLRTSANSLQSSLSAARSTAVAKGVVVTVCKSTTGQTCATDSDWAEGWMVFIDKGTIGTVDAADTDLSTASASDQRVLVQQSVGESVTVVAKSSTGGALNYISFQPTGFTKNADGQFQSGSFLFCDDRGDAAASKRRVVRIGAAGASRVSEPLDGEECSG